MHMHTNYAYKNIKIIHTHTPKCYYMKTEHNNHVNNMNIKCAHLLILITYQHINDFFLGNSDEKEKINESRKQNKIVCQVKSCALHHHDYITKNHIVQIYINCIDLISVTQKITYPLGCHNQGDKLSNLMKNQHESIDFQGRNSLRT